jgi:hypothetical protein
VIEGSLARRPVRLVLALVALGVGLGVGCGGEPDPSAGAPQRGPRQAGAPVGAAPASPAGPAPVRPDRAAAELREATQTPRAWGAGTIEETEEIVDEAPGAPATPRDLGSELRAALGTPTDCLDVETAANLGGSLRVTVRAWVSVTGRVTRAEASGSAPESVRSCIADRAEALSLTAPVEGAPRAVSAELVFGVQAERPPPPPERPLLVLPRGAQSPGVTLPAVGAEGRPGGFVAPSTTLPALVEEGRPAGFVAPSSTLPAQVP